MDEQVESTEGVQNQVKPNNQTQIAGAIVLAGIIVAGAILLRGNMPTRAPVNNPDTGAPVELTRELSKDDHIVGSLDAKVVIVEYSDLECPYCKVFHNTMRRITTEYSGDDVAWVYRHYPIPQLHLKATREAEATECAWAQGGNTAFWNFTNRVFEVTTSNDGLADTQLPKIAGDIGLNVTAFTACLNSGTYSAKVSADVEDGTSLGVNGTPTSFILVDGEIVGKISGAQPYEKVKEQIDALLK